MKFYSLYDLFLSLLRTQLPLHLQQPVIYPYPRRFILMTSCRTETETVNRTEKAGPFDCCCSHQSVASPFLCLCQGSRWTFWAVFVVCSWFSVLSSCWEFLNLGFYRLTVLFIVKSNLSETSYNVWALRRWGGRHNHSQTRSCLLNDFAKN